MQQRHIPKIFVHALALLVLAACNGGSDNAPSINIKGQHPADWFTAHRVAYSRAYLADKAVMCRECHGQDLSGGISKVGCSTTSCHAGGHPPRPVPHEMPFTDSALHGPAAKADISYCQTCHGSPGGAGSNPRFNVAIGSLPYGCEAAGCHNRSNPSLGSYSAAHPRPWKGHASAGNMRNACALCHGADLTGGTGRSCSATGCHIALPVGELPVAGKCGSCHGRPPATGAHQSHNAVPVLSGLCRACHTGGGAGTAKHGNGLANVSTATQFNAKSGTARLNNNKSCINVSCHGGITTPAWGSGNIDTATQCLFCHTAGTSPATPQYNSYYSGRHNLHTTSPINLKCYDCHEPAKLAFTHFSGLATNSFINPKASIRSEVNYLNGSCAPNPASGKFSVGACHDSGATTPFTW